jgi:hypothetical protein
MTTQENVNFIGKGKQFGNKIQISFNWNDLLKLKKTEFKGNKYLVFDVLPLKKEGKFNQTHTIVEHVPIVKES